MIFRKPDKSIVPVMDSAQTHAVFGNVQHKEILAERSREKDEKNSTKNSKPNKSSKSSAWRLFLFTSFYFQSFYFSIEPAMKLRLKMTEFRWKNI